jgi:hypothetical protein
MKTDPFSFAFDPESRCVCVKMWGRISGEDVFRAMAVIYSHEQWAKNFDVCWDLTAAEELLFEWSDYQQWIDLDSMTQDVVGHGRDLILVNTDIHEAVVKSYAVLANRSPRKAFVFRSASALQLALKDSPN